MDHAMKVWGLLNVVIWKRKEGNNVLGRRVCSRMGSSFGCSQYESRRPRFWGLQDLMLANLWVRFYHKSSSNRMWLDRLTCECNCAKRNCEDLEASLSAMLCTCMKNICLPLPLRGRNRQWRKRLFVASEIRTDQPP